MRQHRRGVVFLQRILPQLAPVLRQRIVLRVALVIANEIVKNAPHTGHVRIQFFGQRLPVVDAHAPGQTRAIQVVARQRLGLLIVNALQQVFQTA
ncbi:hypothetical protein D3C80_1044630 [compost metagenome]